MKRLKNFGGAVAVALLLSTVFCLIALSAQTPTERADAYYKQGYTYYVEKDYKLAIPEYDKAISLSPNMAKAYYWRSKSRFALKDYAAARADMVKALNLSPNLYDGPAFLRKIDAVSKPYTPPTVVKTPPPAAPPQPMPVKEEGEKRISMDLRAVEISNAFVLLSKETGQSISVDKNVYGRVTLSLNNVTTREAFDALLKASNCKAVMEGNVIRIVSTEVPNRTQVLPNGMINKTIPLNYVKADDILPTLGSILPAGTKILTTKGSNSIMIEGYEEAVNKAEGIIANLDIPPRQVMVEARIIELSDSNLSALGMNLKYTNPNNPNSIIQTRGLASQPTATGATGLFYSVTNQDLESLLEALSTRTGYNLLSSPRVLAIDGNKAEIITGQRLGYTVKTITDTGLIESVEFLDVGTTLNFTPYIKSDGMIIMDIHPEISEGSIVNNLPQKLTTETTTQLIVRDGETIIIGGLMKEDTQKVNKGVPFLSDIPFIGVPFRRVELTTEKRQILVLISPRIVTADMLGAMSTEAEGWEKKRQEKLYESPIDLVK